MHIFNAYVVFVQTLSSVLSLTLSPYYLCCIGEARSAREAGVSFIFP
jgi:hypothetical protein